MSTTPRSSFSNPAGWLWDSRRGKFAPPKKDVSLGRLGAWAAVRVSSRPVRSPQPPWPLLQKSDVRLRERGCARASAPS
jgi:hypothetical protein